MKSTHFHRDVSRGIIIVLLLCSAIGTGCAFKKEVVFTGRTMGTTYQIKVVAGYFQDTDSLAAEIENRLDDVNQSMSIFREDSEISRLNRHQTQQPFPISAEFAYVMQIGRDLYAKSGGAWDGTVEPLVELWGFGPRKHEFRMPDPAELQKAKSAVDFSHIEIVDGRSIIKHRPDVMLDLGSIAKGFGVDKVAQLIRSKGYQDYLVEVGGEIAASGKRKDGQAWRVGINTPIPGSPLDQVYKVVSLQHQAMATSGDYRNFFVADGVLYSHVIDPRTGYPVSNGVVSVSIIAENCTVADGLATSVMVMGVNDGMALIEKLPSVEGMIVVREESGSLKDYYSTGFKKFLE